VVEAGIAKEVVVLEAKVRRVTRWSGLEGKNAMDDGCVSLLQSAIMSEVSSRLDATSDAGENSHFKETVERDGVESRCLERI
jgi:hypothetical protein